MNLTENDKACLLRNQPILFKDICWLYSRTLGEIFDRSVGIDKFYSYISLVTGVKPNSPEAAGEEKDFFEALSKISDFDFLFFEMSIDSKLREAIKTAFQFFTKEEEIFFLIEDKKIVIGPIEEQHIIDEGNFCDFCTLLKALYWIEPDIVDINPNDDERTRQIKEKLRKSREIRAKIKEKENKEDHVSIIDLICSLAIKIPGLNILNVWDLSYYSFYDQLKRMNYSEEYDVNIRAALAGAKVEKDKMKHWIRSINSNNE